jgi:hypothetical protein
LFGVQLVGAGLKLGELLSTRIRESQLGAVQLLEPGFQVGVIPWFREARSD